jgi:hypothetical protein
MPTTVWPWHKKRYTGAAFPRFEQAQVQIDRVEARDLEVEIDGQRQLLELDPEKILIPAC